MCKKLVIIGNGRSLRDHIYNDDFELLKSVDTFAMNQIDLIFEPDDGLPGTDWRPTHYIYLENKHGFPVRGNINDENNQNGEKWFESIIKNILPFSKVFIDKQFKFNLKKTNISKKQLSKIKFIRRCDLESHIKNGSEWHLPNYCSFGGTMNTVLQMAYQNYDDVAVIGCDLGIKTPNDETFDPNHFHSQYLEMGYKLPGFVFEGENEILERVHRVAKGEFEQAGKRIVNCGIGGELEVYDRMDLKEWLHSNWTSLEKEE